MADKGNVSYLTLDDIYPIGSYVFGQHPKVGTWTEVTGDRAIWLKSSVADGTTISQALPNIEGSFTSERFGWYYGGWSTGAFSTSTTGNLAGSNYDSSNNQKVLRFDASKSNSIYKSGANVQPNAYVMKVYKRTA